MAYTVQPTSLPICIITNLQTTKYTVVPCYPDDISMSISSDWRDTPAIARSTPITAYTGTSFREFNFSIGVHRDMCEAYGNMYGNNVNFDSILEALEDTMYAKYGVGAEYSSPLASFEFGAFLIEGAVVGLNVKYTKPVDYLGRYMYAEIGITIKSIPQNLPSYENFNKCWIEGVNV